MGIQAIGVIIVPVIGIMVLPLISYPIGVWALAIVEEFMGPPDKAGSCSWAELMQRVALTGDMIGFPA